MRIRLIAAALSLIVASACRADIVSTFDADSEGWTVVDLPGTLGNPPNVRAIYAATYRGDEGNPGGSIEATDPDLGPWFWFSAPAKFLGDRSAFLGGSLAMDLRSNLNDATEYPAAILIGNGVALYHVASPPGSSWTSYRIALDPAAWKFGNYVSGRRPTDEEFRGVLGDLDALYLNGDWFSGRETAGLDNVRLTPIPEPSGFVLGLLGLAGFPALGRLRAGARRRSGSGRTVAVPGDGR